MQNWENRDVLVGLLKGVNQLEVNLNNGFYHMPAALLTKSPENVRVIALYQSKRLFGAAAGIAYYGQVTGVSLRERRAILELPRQSAVEPYYYFTIADWSSLPKKIQVRGVAPGSSMFTNQYLLQNSRYVPELYIRTEKEYQLYQMLLGAVLRTKKAGRAQQLPSQKGYEVFVSGRIIGVYSEEGYWEYDFRQFFFAPYSFLQEMGKYIVVK